MKLAASVLFWRERLTNTMFSIIRYWDFNIHAIVWKFMLEQEIVIVTGSSPADRFKNTLKIVSFDVFCLKLFLSEYLAFPTKFLQYIW